METHEGKGGESHPSTCAQAAGDTARIWWFLGCNGLDLSATTPSCPLLYAVPLADNAPLISQGAHAKGEGCADTSHHGQALICPWKCLSQCTACVRRRIVAPVQCHRGLVTKGHKKGLMVAGHRRAFLMDVTGLGPFLTGNKMPFNNKAKELNWLRCGAE